MDERIKAYLTAKPPIEIPDNISDEEMLIYHLVKYNQSEFQSNCDSSIMELSNSNTERLLSQFMDLIQRLSIASEHDDNVKDFLIFIMAVESSSPMIESIYDATNK